jgi:hypothetical protein
VAHTRDPCVFPHFALALALLFLFFPQLFSFYCNLFETSQQLNTRGGTFSDTQFANSTLCFGEMLFLFRDLGLWPALISRAELRHVFDHMAIVATGYVRAHMVR